MAAGDSERDDPGAFNEHPRPSRGAPDAQPEVSCEMSTAFAGAASETDSL